MPCLQVNTTLTELDISRQDPPIGAEGQAFLLAALQVRQPQASRWDVTVLVLQFGVADGCVHAEFVGCGARGLGRSMWP